MIKDNIIEVLHEMEEVTKLFKLEPFDIYIIGGSACILGEYTTRATIDVDFMFCHAVLFCSSLNFERTLRERAIRLLYSLLESDVHPLSAALAT